MGLLNSIRKKGTTAMASNNPWRHMRSAGVADDIDFEIKGQELQFVEIELDPGESLFTTVFTHTGQGKARVAFASPTPGAILPLKLSELGGTLICQKDSFLCAARGVSIGIAFQRRIMTGLFGGEGFIMQKLEGDGWVFVQMGGTLVERELAPGEELHVDTGCLAAYTPGVTFDLIAAGGVKSVLFGGEGLFFARLTGPGKVWIQSLPFARLAGRMLAAAMPGGGQNRGEGSALGVLGDFIDGNR